MVTVAIVTCFFAYKAAFIQVDTDVLNFLPDDDPDVRFFKETGEKFGSNYINFVALEHEDIFRTETLRTLDELTKALEGINGVKQVLSLSNVLDMKDVGVELSVTRLINSEKIPDTPKALKELRGYTLSNPAYVGNLISKDGAVALVSVRIAENADKGKVAYKIREVAKKAAPDYTLYFGGFSMVMEYMGRLIARDMGRLIPITFFVIMGLLFIGFGNFRGVWLTMATLLLAIVWTIGAMSMFGLALSILTSVIPVIVLATGMGSSVYFLARYYQGDPSNEPIEQSLGGVITPIALSGFAMAIGFLSIATAPWTIFKEFGLAAGLGACFSMILSVTFLPAMVSLMKFKAARPFAMAVLNEGSLAWWMDGLGRKVAGHRRVVIVLAFIAMIIAGILYPRIPHNVNLLNYFPQGSEPQEAEKILQQSFGGSQLFIINFRTDDVRHPAVLEQMDMLGKSLRNIDNVNLPQSGADLVKMLNRSMTGEFGIPDESEKVSNLWILLEGQPSVELLVENNFTNGVVQARIGDMDTGIVRKALKNIKSDIEEIVPENLLEIQIAPLDSEQKEKAIKYLAGWITKKVALDFGFHTGTETTSGEQISEVLTTIISSSVYLDGEDSKAVGKALENYFGTDESDLYLSQGDVGPVVNAVAASVISLGGYDHDSVIAALESSVPQSVLDEDPDGTNLAANAVRERISSHVAKKRFAMAFGKTLSLLEIHNPGHALVSDLEDDLWGINAGRIYVNLKDYRRIIGEKPDKRSMVRLQTILTGWPPISSKFDRMLVATQIKSALIVVFTILILLAIGYRSMIGGIIASIPAAFTMLMNFGAMGVMKIPLDNTTIMISSIAVGVGVGYAINYMERVRQELADGAGWEDAVSTTTSTKGRAVLINSLGVALGFAVLALSVMTPQKRFGMLIAFTMIVSALGTFSILPALLLTIKPKFIRR